MNSQIADILRKTDTSGWKEVRVEYAHDFLPILVPPACETLQMKKMPCLAHSRDEIARALNKPTASRTIPEIIRDKGKPAHEVTVCITVSDITRPVPYKGESGILQPLTGIIEQAGVRPENIVLVIGNGMHRPSSQEERLAMYGQEIVDRYRIVDHDCEDLSSMVLAAETSRGTMVYLNKIFFESDVKISTGLVESHFMAGVSGGRKAICPALVNTTTIQKFHSVDFLEHPRATNLILDGNPCHEEALEVARTVGVDFMISTTLDNELCMTGVFAGDLEEAHLAAFEAMKEFVRIPVQEPYDVVLTHAGYVGRDHYQSVKAAVNAVPAVKDQGLIVLFANNVDQEPIGSREYKTLLHLFKMLGPENYLSILQHPAWKFTKDQWEPEMWGKPLRKVGSEGLYYCATQIPEADYKIIPGVAGWEFIDPGRSFASEKEQARIMLQNAVIHAAHHPRFEGSTPRMAFIEEGPYAIPMQES
ncbi:MAG: nickel-dependent lactate racemase [Desulfohalobiaceae bacterium]|nr:nickel-dependent lactate racemase [Desulfohalobiaceae bacterium]